MSRYIMHVSSRAQLFGQETEIGGHKEVQGRSVAYMAVRAGIKKLTRQE